MGRVVVPSRETRIHSPVAKLLTPASLIKCAQPLCEATCEMRERGKVGRIHPRAYILKLDASINHKLTDSSCPFYRYLETAASRYLATAYMLHSASPH